MAILWALQANFGHPSLWCCGKVLHKPGPWRVSANVMQRTKEKTPKSLILLIILKFTGQTS
jgi:hypothetical protein